MKKITINRLILENFKNHAHFELDLIGGNAAIYGDNATGKTSVYDALTWLLFGKDCRGNGEKNIEIKPLDASGAIRDHQAITSVEAILIISDEAVNTEITLRRTLREVWSTKRGSSEPTYDGNTSEYFIDGVPLKKNVFQDKINEIVDEDTFLMLTSVNYFADILDWKKRREILFDISGVASDREIMATDERFIPIIADLGNKTLDEYRAKLGAEKKGLVGARNEIPARINECEKTVMDLSAIDFASAREAANSLSERINALNGELVSLQRNSAADEKNIELREAQLELNKLEMENREHRQSQAVAMPGVNGLKADLKIKLDSIQRLRRSNESLNVKTALCEREIEAARKRWGEVNSEVFTSGVCPTCKQPYPAEQLKAAQASFESHKQERLSSIIAEADKYKNDKAQYEADVAENNGYITEFEAEVKALEEKIAAAESMTVTILDMEGYADTKESITARIKAIEDELYRLNEDSHAACERVKREISKLKAEQTDKLMIASRESALNYASERIEKLREEARAAAEKLAEIENKIYLCEEFSRYKTSFVENGINSLFRIARFRLFREQANGGLEDRCDVVFGGVPYIALNSAAKTNVGIDIINTLSAAYGVTVPLFIDNAESVTRLEGSATQVIRLVVSEKDKELRVNYEN